MTPAHRACHRTAFPGHPHMNTVTCVRSSRLWFPVHDARLTRIDLPRRDAITVDLYVKVGARETLLAAPTR